MTARGRTQPGRKPMRLLSRTIMFSSMLLIAFVIVAPFVYVFIASMQAVGTPGLSWGNWSQLFGTIPVARYMGNSAILAVSSAVVVVLLSSVAGFGFAKLRFPGSQAILIAARQQLPCLLSR